MASIKNLKKDINYILGDVIEECLSWQLMNPTEDTKKSESIIDEAIATFDDLMAKINSKNVDNQKAHFRGITAELEQKAMALLGKVNKL